MKDLLGRLNPRQKKLAVVTIIVGVFIGLLSLAYMLSSGGAGKMRSSSEKKKIGLDQGLLEKAYTEKIRQELEEKDRKIDELQSLLEEIRKHITEKGGKEGLPSSISSPPPPPSSKGTRPFPSPPPPPSRLPPPPPEEKPQPVGGIEVISHTKKKDEKVDGKKKRTVYLPPSFMEATLLTGFSAATMQGAKTYEKPLLLRIKDLAVLPNDVKSNLRGCFVIASAYGDLSDERAHARLVSLSCINRSGESIIDSPIKGFIVDSDGKIGLAGNVVTRAGALLGRSIIAGFFGGMGDAIRAGTTTYSFSPLGTVQTIDPDEVLEAGLGSGLSEGFEKLQDFYLDMAKQTFPVIEVGAAKTVTIVVEEGVELEIKNYCIGGFDRCDREDFS